MKKRSILLAAILSPILICGNALAAAQEVTIAAAHTISPSYEQLTIDNLTDSVVSNITASFPSLVAQVMEIKAPTGQTANTCTNATLSPNQSCVIWLHAKGTTAPSTITENQGLTINWSQNAAPQSKTLSVTASTYLYVGSDQNLLKYDGHKWTTDTPTTLFAPLTVTINNDGVIYASSDSRWLNINKFDGDSWQTVPSSFVSTEVLAVNDIAIDHQGTLYVATDMDNDPQQPVMKFDGNDWQVIGSKSENMPQDPAQLVFDNDNNIYAAGGFNGAGNYVLRKYDVKSSSWSIVTIPGAPNASSYMAVTSNGTLYAGFMGDGTNNVFSSTDEGKTWSAVGGSNTPSYITSLAVGKDGTLYAGTAKNGLYKFNGKSWQQASETKTGAINTLFIDNSGTLYVGTDDSGLYRLDVEGLGNMASYTSAYVNKMAEGSTLTIQNSSSN